VPPMSADKTEIDNEANRGVLPSTPTLPPPRGMRQARASRLALEANANVRQLIISFQFHLDRDGFSFDA